MSKLKIDNSLSSSVSPRLTASSTPSSKISKSSTIKVNSPCNNSTNGVYFVRDHRRRLVGVFKPKDEDSGAKDGIKEGDAVAKEVAAYYLDHKGLAHVPRTKQVLFEDLQTGDRRLGSLQEYIENIGAAEDFSSSLFKEDDIHAIGLLDLRLFNMDRHMGNLIVCGGSSELRLVPIDHGFCLPEFHSLSEAWYEWFSWKQAKQPFSSGIVEYVSELSIQRDVRLLKNLGIAEGSIMTFVLCSILVQTGVRAGLTLYELACLYQRRVDIPETPSALEDMVFCSLDATSLLPEAELMELSDIENNGLVREFRRVLSERLHLFVSINYQ